MKVVELYGMVFAAYGRQKFSRIFSRCVKRALKWLCTEILPPLKTCTKICPSPLNLFTLKFLSPHYLYHPPAINNERPLYMMIFINACRMFSLNWRSCLSSMPQYDMHISCFLYIYRIFELVDWNIICDNI